MTAMDDVLFARLCTIAQWLADRHQEPVLVIPGSRSPINHEERMPYVTLLSVADAYEKANYQRRVEPR